MILPLQYSLIRLIPFVFAPSKVATLDKEGIGYYNTTKFNIMTLSIASLGITTFSITTFSIATLSITNELVAQLSIPVGLGHCHRYFCQHT
jgi:hypothetical protein